jgi:hypothetical protein
MGIIRERISPHKKLGRIFDKASWYCVSLLFTACMGSFLSLMHDFSWKFIMVKSGILMWFISVYQIQINSKMTGAMKSNFSKAISVFVALLIIIAFVQQPDQVKATAASSASPLPSSTPAIRPPTLASLFMTESMAKKGSEMLGFSNINFKTEYPNKKPGPPAIMRIFFNLWSDTEEQSKWISFYIPHSSHPNGTSAIIENIASDYTSFFSMTERTMSLRWESEGDSNPLWARKFRFTGAIYIYNEDPLSMKDVYNFTNLFEKRGASVEFRGAQRVNAVWRSMRLGEARPSPDYQVQIYHGMPNLVCLADCPKNGITFFPAKFVGQTGQPISRQK